MVCYIRIIHICPETNGRRKIFPHTFIFPDTFLTFVNKWNQTIFFNLFFSIQSQQFLYFQLYRKSMCIPSCFSRNHIAFHGTITGNHVFDYTSQYMTNVWFTICCRRTIIKCICLSLFTLFHTFFKNMVFFPELFCVFFSLHEIQIG